MAGIGSQCCEPAPPCHHDSIGHEEPFGPFLSYVVSHPSPKAATVLVSDVFGFATPLFRKLAEKIAADGYFVVAPDYFSGDVFIPGVTKRDEWFKNHDPVDSVADTKSLINVVKSKGFPSIGAVGFCWGAKVVAELAKDDSLGAAVMCHPSLVTVDDIRDVRVPLAVLAAEVDHVTPPALVKQFQEVLKSKEIESFVHIYSGVAHGWTVRYDTNDENAVARAYEAHEKVLEWLGKCVR